MENFACMLVAKLRVKRTGCDRITGLQYHLKGQNIVNVSTILGECWSQMGSPSSPRREIINVSPDRGANPDLQRTVPMLYHWARWIWVLERCGCTHSNIPYSNIMYKTVNHAVNDSFTWNWRRCKQRIVDGKEKQKQRFPSFFFEDWWLLDHQLKSP